MRERERGGGGGLPLSCVTDIESMWDSQTQLRSKDNYGEV